MSCLLTEENINGMRAVYLENKLLRVGILVDRGSDIFEFTYKPAQIDFLLRLKKGIRNPLTDFSQIRNTKNQFEDYYYGGWQVCLPNSPAFNYRGAELGQHGEVSLIPWTLEILDHDPAKLKIKCKADVLRLPLSIERVFTMKADSAALVIEENLRNTSSTDLDIMWGQHIAFGGDFLEAGASIETNAKTMRTEVQMPDNHMFKRGLTYDWPQALDKQGNPVDASKILPKGNGQFSDLCYLDGYDAQAFFTIKNIEKNLGFALTWDGNLFSNLWFWQERNATQDFPWWGDCFTAALEPWTSAWTSDPLNAIKKNEWRKITARTELSTRITAVAFENDFKMSAL